MGRNPERRPRGLRVLGCQKIGHEGFVVLLVLLEKFLVQPLDGEGLFYILQPEVLALVPQLGEPARCGAAGFVFAQEKSVAPGCRLGARDRVGVLIDLAALTGIGEPPVWLARLMEDREHGCGVGLVDESGDEVPQGDAVAGELHLIGDLDLEQGDGVAVGQFVRSGLDRSLDEFAGGDDDLRGLSPLQGAAGEDILKDGPERVAGIGVTQKRLERHGYWHRINGWRELECRRVRVISRPS